MGNSSVSAKRPKDIGSFKKQYEKYNISTSINQVHDGVCHGMCLNWVPDFRYVATHICDSVKRRLKSQGTGVGIQGARALTLRPRWLGSRLETWGRFRNFATSR